MKPYTLLAMLVGLMASCVMPTSRIYAQAPAVSALTARAYIDFDADWRFSKGDFANAMMPAFDDAAWRSLSVPHDWSIEGPLGPQYGSGNGYAPGGIGWYRKHFHLNPSEQGKVVTIEFDGVYDNSEVWINGQFVGGRPYGYSSFECDLTPYLKFDGDNVVSVRVDHSRFADSRWYTGSGIYRNVRLKVTEPVHIGQWGTAITTPAVAADAAQVRIETTIANEGATSQAFSLLSDVLDSDGRVVATQKSGGKIAAGQTQPLVQEVSVSRPSLWSPAAPVRYVVRSRVSIKGEVVDDLITPFGIRMLKYDPNRGLLLNGLPIKLKGVCIHHDAGSLGAAVPEAVFERRLRLLQGLGINAIRTSHYPPAPELLDMCDKLGLMVMEEAFDEFTPPKNKWVEGRNIGQPSKFGYGEYFNDWSIRDIQDMVRRDRNHPSVVMWSIGNEIDYTNDPFSHPILGASYRPQNPPAENLIKLAKPLIAAIKQLDRTRPVTAALATLTMSNAVGLADLLDVVGYNYQEPRYPADHQKYPKRVIYGSENSHSYAAWAAVRDNSYISGQFLWTGIDYLGEANAWPNHASGSGLLDMCGFKKPNAWFRQSLWGDQPMVYICAAAPSASPRPRMTESWNWPAGAVVMVSCYTNCAEMQLTLNGRVIGVKRLTEAVDGVMAFTIPFEPGTLQAIGLNDGKPVSEFALHSAGPANHIELVPDTTQIQSGGKDVSQIEFRIVDANGVRVPDAAPEVTFTLAGPGAIIGIGNGDVNDTEDSKGLSRKAFQGRGLAIVQAGSSPGAITLTATAPGLTPATLTMLVNGAAVAP